MLYRQKMSSRRRRVMHVVSNILPERDHRPQIDIPKRYRKLTFLSVTDKYVRTYAITLRE